MSDFFIENTVNSLAADGFLSSHAISTELAEQNPSQVSSLFDFISYNKVVIFQLSLIYSTF
jgi:hypothetical protein